MKIKKIRQMPFRLFVDKEVGESWLMPWNLKSALVYVDDELMLDFNASLDFWVDEDEVGGDIWEPMKMYGSTTFTFIMDWLKRHKLNSYDFLKGPLRAKLK